MPNPSDADRQQVVDRLRSQLLADRLTLEEFEARAGAIYAARTLDELADLSSGLPAEPAEFSPAPKGQRWGSAAGAVLVVAAVIATTLIATTRQHRSTPAPLAPTSTTVDPAQSIRDLAAQEGWFDGCNASASHLSTFKPANLRRPLDRLSDVIPPSPVEQYREAYRSRVQVTGQNRPWMAVGIDENGAGPVEGFNAGFNDGPPGPGGFGVTAFRFLDTTSAQSAVGRMYTAYVCKFGAEPWTVTSVPGAVGAYLPGAGAQITWAVGNIVLIVEWSIYQDLPEALRRSEAVAAAVMAKIDTSTQSLSG